MPIPIDNNKPRIFSDRNNQIYFYAGCIISLLTWIIFKSYYPYPYFTYDSYLYLADAVANVNVSYRPIGYSKFIRWMSYISHSQYLIVTSQFLLFRFSILYLFLTLRIYLKFGRITSFVLFSFLFLNPIFLDTSNHILSDSLFTAISILWFTQLIWIINRPSKWMIFSQGVLLLLAFVLRYNALYYPAISALILIISPITKRWKVIGICFQFLLVGTFYYYTSSQIMKSTGVFQFSPLSSWKIANNALYMVDNMNTKNAADVPWEFIGIDTFVQKYLKTPHYINKLEEQDITNGSYFIFMKDSPLNEYLTSKYGAVTSQIDFFRVAPYFKKYGNYLIRNNPSGFLKFVIWPNFQQYLMHNTEVFNSGDIKLYYVQQEDERKMASPFIDIAKFRPSVQFGLIRSAIFGIFPMLFFILHLNFIIGLLGVLLINRFKKTLDSRLLLLVLSIWISNLLFSTISAPSVLRFELFNSIVEFSFAIYFFRVLYRYHFINIR